jgi:hypothetical protein
VTTTRVAEQIARFHGCIHTHAAGLELARNPGAVRLVGHKQRRFAAPQPFVNERRDLEAELRVVLEETDRVAGRRNDRVVERNHNCTILRAARTRNQLSSRARDLSHANLGRRFATTSRVL